MRPRLVVRKSIKGMTIQIIDDKGNVVAGIWTPKKNIEKATQKVALQAIKKKVKQVAFDRGSHPYHGLIKKVADFARKEGLEF